MKEEKNFKQGESLSLFEKYAILCFLDYLFEYNQMWVSVVEEIKIKFSHFFYLKIENEKNSINWESIPESPLMTFNNPRYRKQEFNIDEICTKILKV